MPAQPVLFRQGDVLLRAVDALPDSAARVVERDAGRIVLAYGEVTGHAHAIAAPESDATLLMTERARFLRLIADVDLTHEEHAPIRLPQGTYEVIRQREWTDEAGDEEERWRYAGD